MGLFVNLVRVFLTFVLANCALTSGDKSDNHRTQPNIIFFLVDDWGFNDVGYHGNTEILTPHIDEILFEESILIDRHYVLPECTVTRCALLTGRYPMRYGMQSDVLYYSSDYALSQYEMLLSNELKHHGYNTHLIGKWHLGMKSFDYTPTMRGFDSFFGFYGGLLYYYSHYGVDPQIQNAIDFRDDLNEWNESPNTYTMNLYEERILKILEEESEQSDDNNPFFMYVGWQGSHDPSEAPDEYLQMYTTSSTTDHDGYNNIDENMLFTDDNGTDGRLYFEAQTSMTDDIFGSIVEKVKHLGLWDNTLIIFCSDNGAAHGYGDNSPLRGSKFTLWEGGVRTPAFVTGGLIPNELKGTVFNKHVMHITDWYKTIVNGVIGINEDNIYTPNKLDGFNMWNQLIEMKNKDDDNNDNNELIDEELDERFVLLNINRESCTSEVCGALLYRDRWKLILTSNQAYSTEGGQATINSCFWHRSFAKSSDKVDDMCGVSTNEFKDHFIFYDDTSQNVNVDECPCSSGSKACLFDLQNDPCEYFDISDEYPDLYDELYAKLVQFSQREVTPLKSVFPNVNLTQLESSPITYVSENVSFWTPWDDKFWQEMEFEQFLAHNYEINWQQMYQTDGYQFELHLGNGEKRKEMKTLLGYVFLSVSALFLLVWVLYGCMLVSVQRLNVRGMDKTLVDERTSLLPFANAQYTA